MERVRVSRYALEAGGLLNAKSGRRFFEGALVGMGSGFGCLHPWPELGDPSLEECLADLAGPRTLGIVRKTLACIEADGAAREEGRSLFEGIQVPVSHATLPALSAEAVEDAVGRGFKYVKTKAGRDVVKELALVRRLLREWPDLKWRIDFNETGKFDELVGIFKEWGDSELAAVDFLEDPICYEPGRWAGLAKATGLTLANDRHQKDDDGGSDILILKPAVDFLEEGGQRRVVVTSYMDHPLGQAYAAWEAGRTGCSEVCGLQTHGLFLRCGFTEMLGEVGPAFRVPEGVGLGFGELLEGLVWEKWV